jgi:hypothetical protein
VVKVCWRWGSGGELLEVPLGFELWFCPVVLERVRRVDTQC